MEVERYFFYRLYDRRFPELTRYVGLTQNIEQRTHGHMLCAHGGILTGWGKSISHPPVFEIIDSGNFESTTDANRYEKTLVDHYGNQWLLNAVYWRQDKLSHGIPYAAMNRYRRINNGSTSANERIESQRLVSQFPRLSIYYAPYSLPAVSPC